MRPTASGECCQTVGLMNTHPNQNEGTDPAKSSVLSLGLDVHSDQITYVQQRDGGRPSPARRSRQTELLALVQKSVREGHQVYTCYEAGCFGYGLHRKLCALGSTNLVIAPQDWDERHQRVKNDQRDAREMSQRLVRYLHGDDRAFCVVRVPKPEEEYRRARVRQRNSLMRESVQMAARARSTMLTHGVRTGRQWWQTRNWQRLATTLSENLRCLVQPWQELVLDLRKRQRQLEVELIAGVNLAEVPVGVGAWSWECVSAELCDWSRFKNRRQVSSYTGFCPGEHSSGKRRRQGSTPNPVTPTCATA